MFKSFLLGIAGAIIGVLGPFFGAVVFVSGAFVTGLVFGLVCMMIGSYMLYISRHSVRIVNRRGAGRVD